MSIPLPLIPDPQSLAQAIVDTIHEPLLVLDAKLRVVAAGRAFYETFKVDPNETVGSLLYDLGDGQWNAPALRELLETIIPERTAMDGFEVDHDFPGVGRRVMLLNARKVVYAASADTNILLAFTQFAPLPMKYFEGVEPTLIQQADYWQKPVGSGPFKLRRFDGNALIHLDAVPDYWRGWPMADGERVSGIIYRIIREAAPRKAALQRREVDIIAPQTPDDIEQLWPARYATHWNVAEKRGYSGTAIFTTVPPSL